MPKSKRVTPFKSSGFQKFRGLRCVTTENHYIASCHWFFENRLIQLSDIPSCSNNLWKNKLSGLSKLKKGKAGLEKHVNSGIHKTAEYTMNSAKHAA